MAGFFLELPEDKKGKNIGVRTKTKQNEPLNNCTSLEMPVSDDENLTLADTLIDETAVNAADAVEQEDEYRILHEVVDSLQPPLNDIVNAYYFEGKTYKQIGEEMGVSHSTVSSYSSKAMRCLRASPILKELYRENMYGNTHAFIPPDKYWLKYSCK